VASLIKKETKEFTAEIAENAEKKLNNLCVLRDFCGEILLGTASDFMQFHISAASDCERPV
jgi:hypothetical protein